jgi:hypothetical protein
MAFETTIEFMDQDSGSLGTAIVRSTDNRLVGLSTFVTDGGECEVYLSAEDCARLIAALQRAHDDLGT